MYYNYKFMDEFDFSEDEVAKEFICPECNSKEEPEELFTSKGPPSDLSSKKSDPWDSVLQQMECVSCHMIIPAYLGQRWNDLSLEQAQKQWKDLYKKNNKKQKF